MALSGEAFGALCFLSNFPIGLGEDSLSLGSAVSADFVGPAFFELMTFEEDVLSGSGGFD